LIPEDDGGDVDPRAIEILSSATITYKGNDWGPVPLWTIDLKDLFKTSIDVHAYTEAEVRRSPDAIRSVTEVLENQPQ
jgi:hypothetical protein